jgi:hypothetical protein
MSMEQITLKHLVAREINFLNKRIDRKIMNGKPYHREAAKHRALVAQYRRIERRQGANHSIGALLTA